MAQLRISCLNSPKNMEVAAENKVARFNDSQCIYVYTSLTRSVAILLAHLSEEHHGAGARFPMR